MFISTFLWFHTINLPILLGLLHCHGGNDMVEMCDLVLLKLQPNWKNLYIPYKAVVNKKLSALYDPKRKCWQSTTVMSRWQIARHSKSNMASGFLFCGHYLSKSWDEHLDGKNSRKSILAMVGVIGWETCKMFSMFYAEHINKHVRRYLHYLWNTYMAALLHHEN